MFIALLSLFYLFFAIAEFIIHLHDQSNGSLSTFKQSLKDADADFPESFIENLDRIIKTMKPKNKRVNMTEASADEKAKTFPGLAVQDDPEWQKKRKEDIEVADDMMAQLEGINSTSKRRHERSPSPNDRYQRKHHRSSRRSSPGRRYRSRSRSPSRRDSRRRSREAERTRNPDRPSSLQVPSHARGGIMVEDVPSRSIKRMSSPERWELKQLIASGVVDPADYPELNEDLDFNGSIEPEEEIDVEVREEEPPFLRGQTKRSLDLSPVKVVKIPDGTLNRSALAGASLAKERRELRQQQQQQEADAVPQDVTTPWLDPMAGPAGRQFAQDAKGTGRPERISEWKKATFNSATSFGRVTNLSIQEQRESLPVFKLRTDLINAVREVKRSTNGKLKGGKANGYLYRIKC